jgi:SAM-dependent methyltransferase
VLGSDLDYIHVLISEHIISGPVLELGTGYGGATARAEIEAAKLQYYGTDLSPGPGVDFAADFEHSDQMAIFDTVGPFGSVLILNVLEHTFDPIRVLDNAATLLRSGGVLVALTPSVWPLHNYPMDAWRILPNFYEEYAKRRGLDLVEEYFEYVGLGPVANFDNADGTYSYPPPCRPGFRSMLSRAIHKTFNTFGRGMFQPSHIAVAAVFRVR